MAELTRLFDYIGHLPECPTWSAKQDALYWTDILQNEIHRYHPIEKQHSVISFPEEVGCFALREQGGFIVAMRSGIYLTTESGQVTRKVCDNPSNPALARFNDGGTDRDGRFYAGTFWGPGDYNGALLCRVDNNLIPHVIQHNIQGANGLAFSQDRKWMYSSDTPNAVIYRTPLNEQGEPGLRSVFKRFTTGEGIPDGAAIDAEGYYWTALYDGYRIARLSPQGEVVEEHRLPVRCPTMVCFGGSDMKTLFITTTREHMDADELALRPLSGTIFTLQTTVKGLAKTDFREAS